LKIKINKKARISSWLCLILHLPQASRWRRDTKNYGSLRSIGLLCCLWKRASCVAIFRQVDNLFILKHGLLDQKRQSVSYQARRIFSSRHYFCFLECATVRSLIGCLQSISTGDIGDRVHTVHTEVHTLIPQSYELNIHYFL
jgi:hypothetical protein